MDFSPFWGITDGTETRWLLLLCCIIWFASQNIPNALSCVSKITTSRQTLLPTNWDSCRICPGLCGLYDPANIHPRFPSKNVLFVHRKCVRAQLNKEPSFSGNPPSCTGAELLLPLRFAAVCWCHVDGFMAPSKQSFIFGGDRNEFM